MLLMGGEGLTEATKAECQLHRLPAAIALSAAVQGADNRVAHECIDIAKRLIDYGFHARPNFRKIVS